MYEKKILSAIKRSYSKFCDKRNDLQWRVSVNVLRAQTAAAVLKEQHDRIEAIGQGGPMQRRIILGVTNIWICTAIQERAHHFRITKIGCPNYGRPSAVIACVQEFLQLIQTHAFPIAVQQDLQRIQIGRFRCQM